MMDFCNYVDTCLHSLTRSHTLLFLCVPLQFSGQYADEMRKSYAEFCSRHLKAVKLYKELLARDKRFQQFIRVRDRGGRDEGVKHP